MAVKTSIAILHSKRGQAVFENVLLIFIVVTLFIGVKTMLQEMEFVDRLYAPITNEYAKAYQYGHPDVKGPNDPEGPEFHPRIVRPGNFRIFFNPDVNQ